MMKETFTCTRHNSFKRCKYITSSRDLSLKGEMCFCGLVLKHFLFTGKPGEFLCMLRCDGEVAVRQPPQPAAESEGAVPGDQSSNGRASNHSLSTGHQSTGGGIGKYLFFFV